MRKLLAIASVVALLSVPVAANAWSGNGAMAWDVDGAHTEINFSVNHFFTPVSGSFRDFEVDFQFDKDDPENSTVRAKIAVASVSTGNERRDEHLRTGDWFEADKYPYMTFESTSVRRVGADQFMARGPLTIKGISKEIELPVRVLGVQMIPNEMKGMLNGIAEAASFHAATTIARNEFNVGTGSWAATMVVGGDVDIEIVVEANHK